jgi:outer membrane protein TolC
LANQENIDTASLAVEQAQEALELANLRFNAGVGTQLDVLSATRELTEAEGNLVTAVLDYNRALARLERAVSNLADIDETEAVLDL